MTKNEILHDFGLNEISPIVVSLSIRNCRTVITSFSLGVIRYEILDKNLFNCTSHFIQNFVRSA